MIDHSVKKILREEKGFGLLEVVVSAGILLSLIMAVSSMTTYQVGQSNRIKITQQRNQLKFLADQYVRDKMVVDMSLDTSNFPRAAERGNQALDRCLNGNGSSTSCPAGSGGAFPNCCVVSNASGSLFRDFYMVDPGDPSPNSKGRFAGTVSDPQRYDVDGAPCDVASANCLFELVTSYVATCDGGANRCERARTVSVRYQLKTLNELNSDVTLKTIISPPVFVLGSSGPGGGGTVLVVRHNATNPTAPNCPAGFTQLATGYSLAGVYSSADGFQAPQDLGGAGSCVPRFLPTVHTQCKAGYGFATESCDYWTAEDYSSWLTTTGPSNEGNVFGVAAASAKIARCSICEGQGPVYVQHSMSTSVPSCASGYQMLWSGYSLIAGSLNEKLSSGQRLSSTGSCMERFVHFPFIQCTDNRCNYSTEQDVALWLSTSPNNTDMPRRLRNAALPLVSRCAVCAKQ